MSGFLKSWSKEGTIRHRQSKEASILWSHHEETRELPGERDLSRTSSFSVTFQVRKKITDKIQGLSRRRGNPMYITLVVIMRQLQY